LKALFADVEKKDYSATVKGLATSINDYINFIFMFFFVSFLKIVFLAAFLLSL
jgi:hypothetical protein